MHAYITVGCATTGGGKVVTGQNTFLIDGRAIACLGDQATCPTHKRIARIVSGCDPHMIINNKAAALANALLDCGCNCIPNQNLVVGDNGGGFNIATKSTDETVFYFNDPNQDNSLTDDKEEKKKTILCKPECLDEKIIFDTTPGPYTISIELWKFILRYEKYESKSYQPGDNNSGVTLGYGYDLGQQSEAQIRKDLTPYYTTTQIERLLVAQGKKGQVAKNLIAQLSDIIISQDKATQLVTTVKKRYAQYTVDIYPEIVGFHSHCQGVLLSLIFNRGNRLTDKKGELTRSHMRQIRDALKNGTSEQIPAILNAMSQLWNKTGPRGNSGVGDRRRHEAIWFERGLKCDCYK